MTDTYQSTLPERVKVNRRMPTRFGLSMEAAEVGNTVTVLDLALVPQFGIGVYTITAIDDLRITLSLTTWTRRRGPEELTLDFTNHYWDRVIAVAEPDAAPSILIDRLSHLRGVTRTHVLDEESGDSRTEIMLATRGGFIVCEQLTKVAYKNWLRELHEWIKCCACD